MSDVHKIAEQFLKDYAKGKTAYAEERVECEPLSISSLIVLRRNASPAYFYGFKPSGRPVFTHDQKIAKVFNNGCPTIDHHVEKLKMIGEQVEQHLTIWREGREAK